MELLERKTYLDELDGLLCQATTGSGRLLFLGGEAGVGKSALVRTFADQVRPTTRVLTGSCDPLSTPRPLGPLLDIAEQTDGGVNWQAQASNQRVPIFSTFLAELGRKPSLVIIEDAHWADEATLDLLRYLGRRISAAPALLIVTYRDDEVGVGHPLRRVLGDLATAEAVRRLALRPLSLDGVTELAKGGGVDPTDLYRQTGGNPFFVTEVLALGGAGVPSTVRDAVLARTSRLSPAGKQALGVSAVIGSPVEPWLLERLEVNGGAVSECVDRGILIEAGPNLAFRHELGRQAVLDAISPIARVESHSRVLAALRDAPLQDLARLAHHAEQAGNREAVLEYAPAAAARAATLRSHREAAAQYARALRFAHDLPPERRGDLLEALSYECYLTDQPMEAVAACESAVGIWRKAGNRLREGDAERKLSRLLWVSGRALEAQEAGLKAIRILEELPQGSELAMAYSNLSQLCMVAWQSDEAIHWGKRQLPLLSKREKSARWFMRSTTSVLPERTWMMSVGHENWSGVWRLPSSTVLRTMRLEPSQTSVGATSSATGLHRPIHISTKESFTVPSMTSTFGVSITFRCGHISSSFGESGQMR
jgi:tetratricopeptide (TPR) repeat protein